jgi:SWIM zinc finger
MSRPRKPFGAQQPGRLQSTMMKVLAAEMSDPARLRRGKQYARDGSVLDIVIEPGVVTCEVQGSRSTPYIAQLEVSQGDGMPLKRDVRAVCTCPDDDNWDDYACKHVIAAMFTFADELLMEPVLLDDWRGNDVDEATDVGGDDEPWPNDIGDGADHDGDGSDDDETDRDRAPRRKRHLELVRDGVDRARSARDHVPEPESVIDPIAEYLSLPDGASLPDIPQLDRVEPRPPRRSELAAVLRDAYANVRIDWD